MAYGSTQQNYAGPVSSGDMIVKNNQASPGIAALLRKQNMKGAQGIFQLPDTQQANPDFYNQSLMNVQNEIQGQTQTLNAMAPEGESLAYINEQEAGILKLLGGAGEPVNATGIPSFYTTGGGKYGGYSTDRSGAKAAYDKSQAESNKKEEKTSKSVYTKPAKKDAKEFVPMVAGGIGASEFDDDKNIDNNFAQQALINSYVAGAAAQMGGKNYRIGDDAIKGLNALRGQANNTLFSSDFNKMLNRSMQYGDPLTTGNFALGSADNDLIKKSILGLNYTTDDGKRLKYALGGGSSGIGNFAKMLGDNSALSMLLGFLPGESYDDMSFDQRLKAYDNRLENQARQDFLSSRETPKTTTSTTEENGEEEDNEDDDSYDYFGYRRKFQAPMTFKDLIARAYSSDPDRLNMLEDLGDAVKRRDEENA